MSKYVVIFVFLMIVCGCSVRSSSVACKPQTALSLRASAIDAQSLTPSCENIAPKFRHSKLGHTTIPRTPVPGPGFKPTSTDVFRLVNPSTDILEPVSSTEAIWVMRLVHERRPWQRIVVYSRVFRSQERKVRESTGPVTFRHPEYLEFRGVTDGYAEFNVTNGRMCEFSLLR